MASKHFHLYDQLLSDFWFDMIGWNAPKEDTAAGIDLLVKFLMSEIIRCRKLELEGETALIRRGLAMPNSLINAWTHTALVESCRMGIPPSGDLLELIYQRLGCTHLHSEKGKPGSRSQALKLLQEGKSLREIGREIGVDTTTVMKWRDGEIERKRYKPELAELSEKTKVFDFYR
jgi:hypothetical protein